MFQISLFAFAVRRKCVESIKVEKLATNSTNKYELKKYTAFTNFHRLKNLCELCVNLCVLCGKKKMC